MKPICIHVKLLESNSDWQIVRCDIDKIVCIDPISLTLLLIDGKIKAELKKVFVDDAKNIHFICGKDKEYLLFMEETTPCIRIIEKD